MTAVLSKSHRKRTFSQYLLPDSSDALAPEHHRILPAHCMIPYLSTFANPKITKPRPRSQRVRIRSTRYLTQDEHLTLILLRYGTLASDARVYRTYSQISKMTGVKESTIMMVVQKWRRNDFIYECRRSNARGKRKITSDLESSITCAKTLYETAHMSLKERTLYFQERFGAPLVSPATLMKLYNRNGIRYRSASYSYIKKGERQADLQIQQQIFAKQVTSWMHEGREMVFLDETSFHRWQSLRRTWLKGSMTVPIPNTRGASVTAIGAISNKQGLIRSEVFSGSNNLARFRSFIEGLLPLLSLRSIVVMDNLSIHKSSKVKELFQGEQRLVYLPPFSCSLNPIERLWALLKQEWRRVVVCRGTKLSQDQGLLEEEIRSIIRYQDKDKVKQIANSHIKVLIQSLLGHLV